MNRIKTGKLVVTAMLSAIVVVLGMTPLGFIPIGPLNATTMHIPVILAGILEGPLVGGFVGLIFGLSSMFNALTRPTPISICFLNPLIAVLPRVLIGIISYYLYKAMKTIDSDTLRKGTLPFWVLILGFLAYGIVGQIKAGEYGIALWVNVLFAMVVIGLFIALLKYKKGNEAVMLPAFLTTIIHSTMVMGGIYLLFAEEFVKGVGGDINMARSIIFSVILTSGVPEGIVAVIVVTAVVSAVMGSKRLN